MSRKTARIAAMQMIYEQLSGGDGGEESLAVAYETLREEQDLSVNKNDPTVADRAYVQKLLGGVLEHLDEIDEAIAKQSRNWSPDRMPKVDLTIMRMAVWELLYEEDVPGSVVINEAVEIAKRFCDDGADRFINGVLGTILREKEAAQQ